MWTRARVRWLTRVAVVAAAFGLAAPVMAASESGAEASRPPGFLHRIFPQGLSFTVGGGLSGFTSAALQDVTDVGGLWEARLGVATRNPVGFELAYVGSAQGLNTPGLSDSALLLGTLLEGNVRVNVFQQRDLQPYLFGGAGWGHYQVVRSANNTSILARKDNVVVIPMGVGVTYRLDRWLIDGRGTYRQTFASDLIRSGPHAGAAQNSWGARLAVGFEF